MNKKKATYKKGSNTLPNCTCCGRPIRPIKRKGAATLYVEPTPVYYLRTYEEMYLKTTVIDAKTKQECQNAVIVSDGKRGWLPHICK